MKEKVVVLLSSGLDSATNLYFAQVQDEVALAITFNYGQRAAEREIESAKKLTRNLNVPHRIIDVSFIKEFGGSSLTDNSKEIPKGSHVDIESHSKSVETAKSVWVPNRNGIFLNIAAGFAESLNAHAVVPGFNREEATTFPDNSFGFMQALDHSLSFSTANHVVVKCYTHQMDKYEIVQAAVKLGVPFRDIWPCYLDGQKWCGQCESCKRSKRAFEKAGVNVKELFQA